MNKFYIIQSLKSTDPDLGEKVYLNFLDKSNVKFFKTFSKVELFQIFDFISTELSGNKELRGIIHLHCHGNDYGIALRDNADVREFVKWDELRVKFRELYIQTINKPILSMCSFKGFNLLKLVAILEPCPYDYITGSMKKLGFQDSIDAYSCFYNQLNSEKSIEESSLETISQFPDIGFVCLNSIQLFNLCVEGFKESELSVEKLLARKKYLESIILKVSGSINSDQKKFIDFSCSKEGMNEILEGYKKIFFSLK